MKTLLLFSTMLLLISGCSRKKGFDASGSFEAVETIISADGNGTIKRFDIEEGQELKAGQNIGYIDTLQLYLKKKQLQAQIRSILIQKPDISLQLASLRVRLQSAERNQKRTADLARKGSVTQKQLDDANTLVADIKRKIEAQKSSLDISSKFMESQTTPLKYEIKDINAKIRDCLIVNPINGTVLTKYAEQNETAIEGKALYKIANLSSIILRAYFTGSQLSRIKLNDTVKVYANRDGDNYKEYKGRVEWISDKAEFTPKDILTKEERENLVYAVKIRVKNDGYLKIGMNGQVRL